MRRVFIVLVSVFVVFFVFQFMGCKKKDPWERLDRDKYIVYEDDYGNPVIRKKDGLNVIKEPVPTHKESGIPMVKLEMINQVGPVIGDQHILVRPVSFSSDAAGNIYVMDARLKKIYKLSGDGESVSQFGDTTTVSGQLHPRCHPEIHVTGDGGVWISDNINKSLLRYSVDGEFIESFKIPFTGFAHFDFKPMVSVNNDIVIRTGHLCTLEVYRLNDVSAEKRYSLLGPELCNRSIYLDIEGKDGLRYWRSIEMENTGYEWLEDGRLWVYLGHTSTVFIFNGEKQEARFDIWPERALKDYREKTRMPRNYNPMFENWCFDNDSNKHFYLAKHYNYPDVDGSGYFHLYKFDLSGRLIKIYYFKSRGQLRYKRNGRFYITLLDSIEIFGLPGEKR